MLPCNLVVHCILLLLIPVVVTPGLLKLASNVVAQILAPQSPKHNAPLYTPSSTLVEIPGLELNVSYADGGKLEVVLGYEQVNIAALSIEQMVGIVDTAAWYGDGQSSGLLGLGYPSIDSAHDNQNISGHNSLVDLNYTPFFTL